MAVVTGVFAELLSGRAPGLDEIRPEMLKLLEVVGVLQLTQILNVMRKSGTVPLEWKTEGGGLHF